ncbi:hypothetical protein TanjilG_10617 [Lupinus angustifolius]|uniref:Non-specific lipid-transfer protein n=1 Tax=Lupinus angustifolius TaxID=3871 RepID=A0A4P1RWD8_LUPAN|nr:PREDICTED: non-specific lipid-transfer protein 1-like [Lupinus angustifolius]OIW19056.1 hypothetical protein TanjilG_10617 [Lupinus angustifolius]
MAGIVKLACAVLICMVVVSAPLTKAITCGQVTANLAQCLNYLRSGGAVPAPCCNGIKNILNLAKTTPDRRTACNCLKAAAANTPGLNPSNAGSLPGKCGVNIPYKISTSTNCASIK